MRPARRRDPNRASQSLPGRKRRGRRARLRDYTAQLLRTGRLPAFLLSVGLSVLLGAFALSDDFSVDTVIIRGNSIAYVDSIVESSDALGESIFRVDTKVVASRVAAHPAVVSAKVRAELPDRVIVEVVEREPSIVWQTDEVAVLIDEYGWVLAEEDVDDLPRVVELSGDPPGVGTRISPEMVAAVHFLVEELGATTTLEFEDGEGFTVHLPNGQTVTLGGPDELPVKMQVVATVREMDVDWTLLDVRDPDRPYYQ